MTAVLLLMYTLPSFPTATPVTSFSLPPGPAIVRLANTHAGCAGGRRYSRYRMLFQSRAVSACGLLGNALTTRWMAAMPSSGRPVAARHAPAPSRPSDAHGVRGYSIDTWSNRSRASGQRPSLRSVSPDA